MIEPVRISRSERKLIDAARERSRQIGEEIRSFQAPAMTLEPRLLEAVALVEPDADRQSIAATISRLAGLTPRERRTWAGLLTAVVAEVRGLEAKRMRDLARAEQGREDLAPFAKMLTAWSHRMADVGNEITEHGYLAA